MKHYFLPVIPFVFILVYQPLVAMVLVAVFIVICVTSYTLVTDRNNRRVDIASKKLRDKEREMWELRVKTRPFINILHENGFEAKKDEFFYKLDSRKLNFIFSYDRSKKIVMMSGDPKWMDMGVFTEAGVYFAVREMEDSLYGDDLLYNRALLDDKDRLKKSWMIPYRLLGYSCAIALLTVLSLDNDPSSMFMMAIFGTMIYAIADLM